MADPKIQYEYGRTPERTASGILGFFNLLSGPLVDAFTPKRREVITPSQTTYTEADGMYYPNTTPGVYGPVERGVEYMPVVQGAKSAYEFLGELISSGKKRGETADALVKGIGTLLEDQKRAGINAGLGGDLQFYDPEQKRVVGYDPLLVPTLAAAGAIAAPVRGPGAVVGMFAGRRASNADLDALETAKKMENKGHSRDEIWDQTGWFRFNDRDGKPMGEWKFEIPDEASFAVSDPAALKPYLTPTGRVKEGSGRTGYGPEIDKLLVHDELYKKAYPGVDLAENIVSLDEITRKRAALIPKLAELRAKKNEMDPSEYQKAVNALEEEDAGLLRELLKNMPISEFPGGPAKTAREKFPLMDRPIGDTLVERTTSGGGLSGGTAGYYQPGLNIMAVRRDRYKDASYQMDPKYFELYEKAQKDFEDAGLSLRALLSGMEVPKTGLRSGYNLEYRVRKLGERGPEGVVDPKTLPKNLKKQLAQLEKYEPEQKRKDQLREFRSVALHELQHAIQQREGFEKGGDPSYFQGRKLPINPKTGKRYTPYELYEALVGETEARLVQERRDMTPEERRATPPYSQVDESMMYTRKDLGVQSKASGGMVDKPLYGNARVIG